MNIISIFIIIVVTSAVVALVKTFFLYTKPKDNRQETIAVKDRIVLTEKWYAWARKRKKAIIMNTIFQSLWLWLTLSLWAKYPDGRLEVIYGMLFLLLAWVLLVWGKAIYVAFVPKKYEIAIIGGHYIVTQNGKVILDTLSGRIMHFNFISELNCSLAFKLDYLPEKDNTNITHFLLNLAFIPENECSLVWPHFIKFYKGI